MLLKGGASNAQRIANAQRTADCSVAQWSLDNGVQLNSEKFKELRVSFIKKQSESVIIFL